jgi:PAS domain S-box-containing protein
MLSTVLLVDDDINNLYLMEKILKHKGFQVILAHNGADALTLVQHSRPELVVSDILIPVMDGFTFCQKWCKDPVLKKIPFVFYTATYTDSRDEQLALSLGAARFIIKPVDPHTLVEIIQSVIDEFSKGESLIGEPVVQNEEVILSRYNETLVHKLEQKVQEMKEINLALEKEIARREMAETALRQSEEKLRRVFDALSGGIVITDLNGVIIECNSNSYVIAGYNTKEEFIGKNLIDFLPFDEKSKALNNIQFTLDKGSSHNNEYSVIKSNGNLLPVEVSSCAVKDQNGIPFCVVISIVDVTERKHMEDKILELYEHEKKQREELQEEAKSRSLFIEVLGHELRTPLTPVLASAGMLEDILNSTQDSICKKLSGTIRNGAFTLATRLDELLDLANYSRGTFRLQIEATDIDQLVKEVIAGFQPSPGTKSQQIVFSSTGDLSQIRIDPARLKLVLFNLLSNASKFNPQNGEILVNAARRDHKFCLDVSDKGAGLSKEEQKRLFQPYHRVEQDRQKFPGLGLGLAICRQIIEAHGGKIWVTSQVNQGSTFSFYIPLRAA